MNSNSNNNNIPMINHPYKTAKGLKRYVRDILQQVQQEETLKKIIDISSKIDYPVIYHLLSSTYKCNFLGADNKQ